MQQTENADTGASILKDYIRGDEELARVINRSPRTVARWRALGEGPPFTRMGREILYHIPSFKAWLQAQRVEARS